MRGGRRGGLPTDVIGSAGGLAGALPPSLGELGSSLTDLLLAFNAMTSLPTEIAALTGLTRLNLDFNAITSVPTELAALTGLEDLFVGGNQLTGVLSEFRSVDPSEECDLFNNPGFSCANVGAGTSCCTGATNPAGGPGNCGEGLSGGPCYDG